MSGLHKKGGRLHKKGRTVIDTRTKFVRHGNGIAIAPKARYDGMRNRLRLDCNGQMVLKEALRERVAGDGGRK